MSREERAPRPADWEAQWSSGSNVLSAFLLHHPQLVGLSSWLIPHGCRMAAAAPNITDSFNNVLKARRKNAPFLSLINWKKTFEEYLYMPHSEIFLYIAHWLESCPMTIPNPISGKDREVIGLALGWGETWHPLESSFSHYLHQMWVHLTRKEFVNSCCLGIRKLCHLLWGSASQWFPQCTPQRKTWYHTVHWSKLEGIGEPLRGLVKIITTFSLCYIIMIGKWNKNDVNIEFV